MANHSCQINGYVFQINGYVYIYIYLYISIFIFPFDDPFPLARLCQNHLRHLRAFAAACLSQEGHHSRGATNHRNDLPRNTEEWDPMEPNGWVNKGNIPIWCTIIGQKSASPEMGNLTDKAPYFMGKSEIGLASGEDFPLNQSIE